MPVTTTPMRVILSLGIMPEKLILQAIGIASWEIVPATPILPVTATSLSGRYLAISITVRRRIPLSDILPATPTPRGAIIH